MLKDWNETLHSGVDVTAGMRALLELLLREGSMSVPDAARARSVSRQLIQQQVDSLLDRKLVQREPNPAHKRSPLIGLTDRGRALIQNMRAEELHALSRLQAGTSDSAMRDAAQVLAAWAETLSIDTGRRKQ
ncbi:MAG: MarR family transcriptional regulator [Myxococcales bacterium]|nr:MarR family transcriptional regulator [Myxococcales bacterium]MDH3483148.1 MarR family transcriptional regulator [Myxococcales bacterium]